MKTALWIYLFICMRWNLPFLPNNPTNKQKMGVKLPTHSSLASQVPSCLPIKVTRLNVGGKFCTSRIFQVCTWELGRAVSVKPEQLCSLLPGAPWNKWCWSPGTENTPTSSALVLSVHRCMHMRSHTHSVEINKQLPNFISIKSCFKTKISFVASYSNG